MFLMTLIGTVLLVVLGKAVFHLRFAGNVFSVAAGLTLCCLSFFTLGFVLAGLARIREGRPDRFDAHLLPDALPVGGDNPREAMPQTIRQVSEYLPLTHVVILLRGLWFGEAWGKHLTEVGVLAGMLVVGVLISAKTFRWE